MQMGYELGANTDVFHLFRRFRHDLLNDLQILGGHLQMNKGKDVLTEDIHTMTKRIQQLSCLFSCGDNQLALSLWALQEKAADYEVQLSIDAEPVGAPVSPEWHQALLEVGSQLIEQLSGLPEQPQVLCLRLALPISVTFQLSSANPVRDFTVPGFSVQAEILDSRLDITVTAGPGEE